MSDAVHVIGNRDGAGISTVDDHGALIPWPGGWMVDWLVRSSKRWHAPADEAVTQRLVDGMPVVETSMRIPGGHAVHTVWCRARAGGDEVAVVEIENRSKQPVAAALVVRTKGRLDLDGNVLRAGRKRALLLPRPPSRCAASLATLVDDGGDERWPDGAKGEAAVVFPLAHTASLRAAVLLNGAAAPDLDAIPSAERVANGWRVHAEPPGSMRLVLPDERLAEDVLAARARLLLPGADTDDAFLRDVRNRLVREIDRGTLALAPVWPPEWAGQGLEVHDAPTSFGTVSFAVRWHGVRPALLWDLEARAAPPTLIAPALDPTWSTTEARGEALLAPVGLPKVEAPLDTEGVPAASAPEAGSFS